MCTRNNNNNNNATRFVPWENTSADTFRYAARAVRLKVYTHDVYNVRILMLLYINCAWASRNNNGLGRLEEFSGKQPFPTRFLSPIDATCTLLSAETHTSAFVQYALYYYYVTIIYIYIRAESFSSVPATGRTMFMNRVLVRAETFDGRNN